MVRATLRVRGVNSASLASNASATRLATDETTLSFADAHYGPPHNP